MINTTAQNTLKNSGYNFIGFVVPLFVFIFATPIIVAKLGVEQYGIYVLLNTTLTLLGLLDLGVSVANSKHMIEYYTTNQVEKLKRLVYSMNSVYAILAGVYMLSCVGIGLVVKHMTHADGRHDYFVLFCLIGLIGAINSVFGNFFNSLFMLQKVGLHIVINTTFLILQNINLLVLSYAGYTLVHIMAVQVVLAVASSVVYFIAGKKNFPVLQLKYMWAKEEIYKNYKYGLTVAFNNIASSSLVHFDKLLIPVFTGPAQLTYYSVPGAITNRISGISSTFSTLLFPITVSLHSLSDAEKLKRVYQRSVRLIAILATSISLSIIGVADKILLYWIDENFAKQTTMVLIVLTITNGILAIFNPLSQMLMAMNKMKFLTTGTIVMAGVNILALCVLMPFFGINGAAVAYLLGVLPIVGMFYYAEKKYFKVSYVKQHMVLFFKLLSTAIPFLVFMRYMVYPVIANFMTIIVVLPVCVLLFLVLYKLFGFVEQEDWNDAKLFLQKIALKIGIKKP